MARYLTFDGDISMVESQGFLFSDLDVAELSRLTGFQSCELQSWLIGKVDVPEIARGRLARGLYLSLLKNSCSVVVTYLSRPVGFLGSGEMSVVSEEKFPNLRYAIKWLEMNPQIGSFSISMCSNLSAAAFEFVRCEKYFSPEDIYKLLDDPESCRKIASCVFHGING